MTTEIKKERDYRILNDKNGNPMCKIIIEWTNQNYGIHHVETKDPDEAETIIGLLTGNICLADLEP